MCVGGELLLCHFYAPKYHVLWKLACKCSKREFVLAFSLSFFFFSVHYSSPIHYKFLFKNYLSGWRHQRQSKFEISLIVSPFLTQGFFVFFVNHPLCEWFCECSRSYPHSLGSFWNVRVLWLWGSLGHRSKWLALVDMLKQFMVFPDCLGAVNPEETFALHYVLSLCVII